MRIGIVETFVMTAVFVAAIAAITAMTNRAPVRTCSALVTVEGMPGDHTESLQPHWLED